MACHTDQPCQASHHDNLVAADQDTYYHHRIRLLASGLAQEFELRLLRAGAAPFWAQLILTSEQAMGGAPMFRLDCQQIPLGQTFSAMMSPWTVDAVWIKRSFMRRRLGNWVSSSQSSRGRRHHGGTPVQRQHWCAGVHRQQHLAKRHPPTGGYGDVPSQARWSQPGAVLSGHLAALCAGARTMRVVCCIIG